MSMAMGGSIIDKAVLGVLALVALGLMLSMVKKAARRVELPTAEELVGLPPQLEARSDLIGDAGEGESAMTGIEIGDDEVRVQKMLEQVKEYVGTTPDSAARIVNRWLTQEN
jgi:flagellar biosynthesis/type III secretory pathway M-ring protein FliF/YscJ